MRDAKKGKSLSFIDAAELVLEGQGKPMHYREITDRARKLASFWTDGKTPEESMCARLGTEINTGHGKGRLSRFYREGKGFYGLVKFRNEHHELDLIATQRQPAKRKESRVGRRMSWQDAAYRVLAEHGGPMHCDKIAKLALAAQYISSRGKTPGNTICSRLGEEMRHGRKGGGKNRFRKPGIGLFDLEASAVVQRAGSSYASANQPARERATPVAVRGAQANSSPKNVILRVLSDCKVPEFERRIRQLLVAVGCEKFSAVERKRDGSFFQKCTLVVAGTVRIKLVVFAANAPGETGKEVIELLRGKMPTYAQGLALSVGGFTRQAKRAAANSRAAPVALVGGEELAQKVIDYVYDDGKDE